MELLFAAPPLFFVIALAFSILGLGGGLLYIPILFWLGMDLKTEAIPLGMLLNVVNGSTAAVTYVAQGIVKWRIALPFGIAMVALAPVGALLNARVPRDPLLIALAAFTGLAALLMLYGWQPERGELTGRSAVLVGLSSGSVLGLVAGLLGVGGGVFVVPLLYLVGLSPKAAAATSALVVVGSGLSSFVSHLIIGARPEWGVWLAAAASVFLGSEIGSRVISGRLNPRATQSVFGVVLLVVAIVLVVKDLVFAG